MLLSLLGRDRPFIAGDLEEEYQDSVRPARGRTAADAWFWRQTLVALGAFLAHRIHQSWTGALDHSSSLREAARSLRRSPLFTLTASASLGMAIGACTSVLAVVNALYWTEPPFPEPERLARIMATVSPETPQIADYVLPERMEAWLARDFRTLERFSAVFEKGFSTDQWGEPEYLPGYVVTGRYFDAMGVPARLGRLIGEDDDRAGAEPAAVISERLWQERFDGASALGASLRLGGTPFTVIGVMPKTFEDGRAVWVPRSVVPEQQRPGAWQGTARLREGETFATATVELQAMARAEVAADSVGTLGQGAAAWPARELGNNANKQGLWLAIGVAAVTLLIALTNLTNLFLVRAGARGRTLAIRAALGGSRWRLGRVLVAESLLIAGIAALVGVRIAIAGKEWVRSLLGAGYTSSVGPAMDFAVLSGTVALALVAAVVVGGEPLRHLRGLDVRRLLQDGGSMTTLGVRQRRVRDAVVGVQVALSVVLLGGAGVLAVAMHDFRSIDLGYDSSKIVTAELDYQGGRVDRTDETRIAESVSERMVARPDVAAAGFWRATRSPYPPRRERSVQFRGREFNARETVGWYFEMSPDVFDVLDVEVVEGRGFTDEDHAASPPVAILASAFARKLWPDGGALAEQVRMGDGDPWRTVVGVVEDFDGPHYLSRFWAANRLIGNGLYVPAAQGGVLPDGWVAGPCPACRGTILAVRSATPDQVTGTLREEIAALAPAVRIGSVRTLLDRQMDAYGGYQLRINQRLVTGASIVGALLALLGIFAVVADGVSRRTRELGVRMALGAAGKRLLGTVLKESALTAALGLACGIGVILVLEEWVVKLLLPASQALIPIAALTDWRLLALVSAVILAATTVASLAGVRRALTMDPTRALRSE